MKQKPKIPILRTLELYNGSDAFKRLVELAEYYCLEDIAMQSLRKSFPGVLTIMGSFIMVAMGSLLFVESDYSGNHPLLILGALLVAILSILRDSLRAEKRKLQIQEGRLAITRNLNSFVTVHDLHFFEKIICENENLDEKASEVVQIFFISAREILDLKEQDFQSDFTKPLRNFLSWDAQE